MKKNLINEVRELQKIAGILKRSNITENFKPGTVNGEHPEIYNDGNHRLILVWEERMGNGTLAIADDFNGKDWDVVWQVDNIIPQLTKALSTEK